jgi:hypothetical protein
MKIRALTRQTPHCVYFVREIVHALQSSGVIRSSTAIDGVNPPSSDPLHLRRVMAA